MHILVCLTYILTYRREFVFKTPTDNSVCQIFFKFQNSVRLNCLMIGYGFNFSMGYQETLKIKIHRRRFTLIKTQHYIH